MNFWHYLEANPWWAMTYLAAFFVGTYTVARVFAPAKCRRCGH